jgi:integrase
MRQSGSKTAHTIVHVPITERPNALFPLLILRDGRPSLTVAAHARVLQRSNFSPTKIYESVAAIGRLYDFYVFKLGGTALKVSQRRTLLQQFAEARLYGTLQPDDKIDPSGLYWSRVKYETMRKDLDYVTAFAKWITDNFNTFPLTHLEDQYSSTVREAFRASIMMNTSMLAHLLPARKGYKIEREFRVKNNTGTHLRDIPKVFPPDKVIQLIDAPKNPRDKILLILMAFGSLRVSEVCHVFLEDMFGYFPNTGAAKVILGHPVEGHFRWIDKSGQQRSGTRAEYLMDMYKHVPRNELYGHSEYAGWKGMEFGNKSNTGFIYWANEKVGIYFRRLLEEYFFDVFAGKPEGWPGHPYGLVKLDREHYGEPLTVANASNIFYYNAKKIGLNIHQEGVSPHGLRHWYGFYCADVLGIKLDILQIQMHHASPNSTMVYYHVRPGTIRKQLLSAQVSSEANENAFKLIKQSFRDLDVTFPSDWHSRLKDPFGLQAYYRSREALD